MGNERPQSHTEKSKCSFKFQIPITNVIMILDLNIFAAQPECFFFFPLFLFQFKGQFAKYLHLGLTHASLFPWEAEKQQLEWQGRASVKTNFVPINIKLIFLPNNNKHGVLAQWR